MHCPKKLLLFCLNLLLASSCSNFSGQGSGLCPTLNTSKTKSTPIQNVYISGKTDYELSVPQIDSNNYAEYTFEGKIGQSLSYSTPTKNLCIFVSSPTGADLSHVDFGFLPENGKYTLEVYSLATKKPFNLKFSLINQQLFAIPAELEKQALYQFKTTKQAISSLPNIVRQELDKNNDQISQEAPTNLEKFESDEEILQEFDRIIGLQGNERQKIIDQVNNLDSIQEFQQNIYKLINAIYLYQKRTPSLYRDRNGKLKKERDKIINGILNQETIAAITNEIIGQNSTENHPIYSPQNLSYTQIKNAQKRAENLITIYYDNIRDRQCQKSWDMLSERSKNGYNYKESEYFDWCTEVESLKYYKLNIASIIPDKSIIGNITLEITMKASQKRTDRKTICLPKPEDIKQDSKLTIIHSGSCE